MKTPIAFTKLLLVLLALIISVGTVSQGLAQQPEGEKNDQESIKEQTIYIPFDKLREVFERDGRGVFLPYDKFQKLWNEARNNQPEQPDIAAPMGALITDIESTATLGKEIVGVDARLKIELLRNGWHQVPLRLKDAAIRSATIDGQEARVISTENGEYALLVAHDGDQPKTIQLDISYAKSMAKTGGQSVVAFQAPQAPVNRWTIRTGQKDIDVQIEPMIASSKKTADDDATPDREDEILAFVGAAPEVKIIWTPKSEGATGLAALVSADTQTKFQIDQGVARTSANVQLDISRAEITQVELEVPVDQKVVSIFDRNVKKWEVKPGEDSQTITIELFEPALGRQSLAVELEKFIDEIDDTSIAVPQIKVTQVSRNSGVVLVNLSSDLRAEPETKTGLLQMDPSELPDQLKNQSWGFAYRYASLPYELKLNVKKIQPLINVNQLIEVAIRPEKLLAALTINYDIQLAGVFQVYFDIPKSFQIREIRPQQQSSFTVDTFYRDPENENRVIVTLSKKAMGDVGLLVSLEQDLDDANLLKPTDVESTIEFSLPKSTIEGVEFSQGSLVVYAPESLQVNASETSGLRNESFQNAFQAHQPTLASSDTRPILAYSFSHTDAKIELTAKRRRPQVSVEQVQVISVQSGVVKYDTRLFYEVLYSGVNSIRLDVPTALVDELRNRSNNMLHQPMDPAPEDVADGYTAWRLTSDNEFFGKHEIRFTWQQDIPDLPLGESTEIAVDRLIPANVDQAEGQIVLTKSETIDVRPNLDATGLRPIDPQTDLVDGVSIENAALAFAFTDDWSLNLTATRFELQDLKRTSITRAVVRAVALRQNELSIQCLYQMRSVGQRISIQMPAGFDAATSFDDQPVRVNGQRVTPERGGQDLIYIPLTGQTSDEPFLLELRYTIPGDHHQIDLPVFTDDPAVQKVYLCVYIPHEKALLHKSGDWTDEAIDEHTTSIAGLIQSQNSNSMVARMFRRRNENVDTYLSWVREGIAADISTSQNFEVDGRPYVFSALRPEPAPAGSLHLRTINITFLNFLICSVIGLIGLLLIRTRLTHQLAGGLLILAALIFIGVFFPLITEHLIGEALLLTAAVVAIAWLISDGSRWLGQIRLERERLAELRPVFTPVGGTPMPTAEALEADRTRGPRHSPPDNEPLASDDPPSPDESRDDHEGGAQ